MKIWQSYGSAHSAALNVVGRFQKLDNAKAAYEIVSAWLDATRGAGRGINPTPEQLKPAHVEFYASWKDKYPGLEHHGPSFADFDGMCFGDDDSAKEKLSGDNVSVEDIRTSEIGGIIKLLLMFEPSAVQVTGRTGP
jgi:hypothetical protein